MDAGRGVFVAGALAADGGGIVMAASMAADGAWEAIRLPAGTEARRFRKSPDGAWWLAHDLEPKDPREPSVVWLGHHGKDGWTSRMLSHPAACREVAFGAGDGRFTTMDHFFAWRRWRLDSGRLEAQHSLASAEVVDSALSDDGKVAALIKADRRRMDVWTWDDSGTPRLGGSYPGDFGEVGFLAGSRWLLDEDPVRRRRILDARSGQGLSIPRGTLDGGRKPAWNPSASRLLHGLESSSVAIVDLPAATVRRWTHPIDGRGVRHAVLSQTGRWTAVVDREEGVRWVETLSGRPVSRRIVPGGRVRWVGFTGDSAMVILSDPNQMEVEAMMPWRGKAGMLRDWATFVSGRRRDANGSIEWLAPDALEAMASRVSRP